ncbi:MAG: hypothetical protein HY043_20685 [Verrucomicrobia bacterium]|nr:hypothetical protein [Verrucomicrobiota bacterium]
MKKLLLALTLVAFSTALSVQAGGDACCAQKTKTSASAKSTCTAAKSACSAGAKQAKSSAPATARGTLLAKN